MRRAAKVEFKRTILAHSRSYLVGSQTWNVIIQCLDFLEESLPVASAGKLRQRETYMRTVFPAPSRPMMMTENSSFRVRYW